MSGLIVAAITGAAPVWAATQDNMSITSTDGLTAVTGSGSGGSNAGIIGGAIDTAVVNGSIKSLTVKNANLYVSNNLTVTGGSASHAAALGDNAKVIIGQNSSGASAGATLTVDNMSVNGANAEVLVTSSSTLASTGDIDIFNGALTLNEGTVNAANVNIASSGTLQATGGVNNLVNASQAVNLNGGTIYVAKDAVMTLGGTVNSTPAAVLGQYGTLNVIGNTLNSTGGNIKAHMVQSGGTINYNAGVTTVDNMTISNGTSTIASGATLSITQDKPLITGSGAVLDMQGGVLTIAGGGGTLLVQNGGELKASAGDNTVNGSVNLNGGTGGKLTVGPTDGIAASLNITKDLAIGNGQVTVGGAGTLGGQHQLTVQGSTTADSGTLTVGATGKMSAQVGDFVSGAGAQTGGTWTKELNATTTNDGILYLTGFTGEYWQADLTNIQSLFSGSGQVALVGGTLQDTGILLNSTVLAPSQGLTITDAPDGSTAMLSGAKEAASLTFQAGNSPSSVELSPGTGASLQLNGTGGTNLLSDANGKALDIDVNDGKLLLGNSLIASAVPNQGGHMANITVGGGTVGVAVGNYSATSLTFDAPNGELRITDGGSLTLGALTALDNTHDIRVGDDTGKGTLVANNVRLKGSTLFLDPAWSTSGTNPVTNASQAALKFTNNAVDGLLTAGQNSLLTVGSTDTAWLAARVQEVGGWGPNGTTAAFGVNAPVTLTAVGGILVDGAINTGNYDTGTGTIAAAGDVALRNNSLLVVNFDAIGERAAITGTGGGTVQIGTNPATDAPVNTKLYVNGLKKGDYTLFANFGGITGDFTDIINPDRMLDPSFSAAGGTGTLRVARNSATDVFPGLSGALGDLVNNVWDKRKNNVDSGNAGIRFVSRAAHSDYVGGGREGARMLEGAARLAVVGAAPGVTLDASKAATATATSRTSFANALQGSGNAVAMLKDEATNQWKAESGLSAGDGMKNGAALWIAPLYRNSSVWGMKADEFKTGYSSNLGGVAVGGDYTFNDAFRLGLALNLGGGYAQSSGDFNSTDNRFNFWGINAYGGWSQNNFGLSADVGYTSVFNAVEQDMQSGMGMGNLKADVNSSVWTAALRAEYKIQTSVMDVIPHISARYTGLKIDSYDVKSGGTVFETEESNQSIWTFPIGVTLSKEIESSNGWKFKPQVDLAVVPAAGDVKAKSKVKIPGMGTTADLSTQVVDYVTFDGGLGFEVQKDNVAFGLNYNIQASEHRTGHGVFGIFRYEF